MYTLQILILFLVIISHTHGASILFYFGVATYSHRVVVWPLVERLAKDGHDVTFLSGYEPKKPNPNVTEFIPKSLSDLMAKSLGADSDLIQLRMSQEHVGIWRAAEDFGIQMCEGLMYDEDYLALVRNKKFDLVIVDALNNDCAHGIVHYQKTKLMIFSTTHPNMWHYDMFGIPAETSWIPDQAYAYKLPMSFVERFINTLRPLLWYYGRVFRMYPKLEAVINKQLGLTGESALSIRDVEKNVSLILTNTHYSLEYSRSLPPLYVPVGGMHIDRTPGELPKDLKKFADESGSNGFIYISFGSGAQISKAKPELQQVFFNSLRKFKTRFIWKWEGEHIPAEMPPNVYTAKWMPQNDILRHPNIKAFITHGGLLGIEEAAIYAVPLIVFPIFAEQDYNADRIHRLGYGIRLEITTVTEKDLTDAITAVSTNPSYKEKMLEVSNFFTDRPADPLETAVWLVEFVLRNKRNPFIMPLGAHQPWYVRRSLDVWGPIIGGAFFILGLLLGCSYKRKERPEKAKNE